MMDVLRTGTSALAHWDPDAAANSPEANFRKSERLLAQTSVLIGAFQRIREGQEPLIPSASRSLAGNLMYMLTGKEPSPRMTKAMDVSLILYAEHEYNASTITARVICSTLSDLHSSITGAIGALKGPLHGGANERVLEVLESVGSADKAEAWVRDMLARKQKIMGFGHRVYKTGDPRATYLKTLWRRTGSRENGARRHGADGRHHRRGRDAREEAAAESSDWPSTPDCTTLHGPEGGPVHSVVCGQPRSGLERSRDGTTGCEPADPAAFALYRPGGSPLEEPGAAVRFGQVLRTGRGRAT